MEVLAQSLELGTADATIVGLKGSVGTIAAPTPPPLATLELGTDAAAAPPPPVELAVVDSEAIFLLLVVAVEDYKNIDVHYYMYVVK